MPKRVDFNQPGRRGPGQLTVGYRPSTGECILRLDQGRRWIQHGMSPVQMQQLALRMYATTIHAQTGLPYADPVAVPTVHRAPKWSVRKKAR